MKVENVFSLGDTGPCLISILAKTHFFFGFQVIQDRASTIPILAKADTMTAEVTILQFIFKFFFVAEATSSIKYVSSINLFSFMISRNRNLKKKKVSKVLCIVTLYSTYTARTFDFFFKGALSFF